MPWTVSWRKKWCHKGTWGTSDLLYIDQQILKEIKARRENVDMEWIDYKNAYDMVSHSWIVDFLKMYKISQTWSQRPWKNGKWNWQQKEKLLQRWKSWEVSLLIPLNYILRKCTGSCKFTKFPKRINLLMYMDGMKLFAKNEKELETLIQTIRIYSKNIGMEFSLQKMSRAHSAKGKKSVVYGPPTRLNCQNRKCTSVNNRCIRSRNIRT